MIPTHRSPTHPGEMLLKEFLEPSGLTQKAFAAHLGWTYARLNEIINKRRSVTADSALAFAEAFGMEDVAFWLNLQRDWDLWRARQKHIKVKRLKNLDKKNNISEPKSLILFQEKSIRRTWHENEWWFAVSDVVAALTNSPDAGAYWRKLKQRLKDEGSELVTFCHGLKITAFDNKQRITDCANTAGILRIIQSIPSPKAEPFKRWLTKVGYERIQEIENPELAQERMKQLYEQKGYPKDWIDKRLQGIAIPQNLTDEWQERGITNQNDYAILTTEISKAMFGMTPQEYKKFKNFPRNFKENLRDHMTDLELIFTMLGEKVTTEISKQEKPEGMVENKKVAKSGAAFLIKR